MRATCSLRLSEVGVSAATDGGEGTTAGEGPGGTSLHLLRRLRHLLLAHNTTGEYHLVLVCDLKPDVRRAVTVH